MPGRIQKYLLVVGGLMIIGNVLAGLILAQVIAGWHEVIKVGNETATILNLKTIAVVESTSYYAQKRRFGTFEELIGEQFLSSKFTGDPVKTDGYVIRLTLKSDPPGYSLTADPETQATGARHFYFDSISRQIHVSGNQPAGPDDPLLDNK